LTPYPLFPYFAHVLHAPQPIPLDRENPMAKSMIRHWAPFLLSILLSVAANRAEAQLVTVNFQGQTSDSPPVPISGTFTYNSSVTTDSDTFVFTKLPVSTGRHDIRYRISGALPQTGSGSACDPYFIQISGNQFILTATLPQAPPSQRTTVQITITMNRPITTSPLTLPDCSFFPSSPPGTFPHTLTLSSSGGSSRSASIAITSCSPPTAFAALAWKPPSHPAPSEPPPSHPAPSEPPPCYVYTCTYPAPAPCPVYTCPPRHECCLTRLFARRSSRNSCW